MSEFKLGDRVRHKVYGEGYIKDTDDQKLRGTGTTEYLVVFDERHPNLHGHWCGADYSRCWWFGYCDWPLSELELIQEEPPTNVGKYCCNCNYANARYEAAHEYCGSCLDKSNWTSIETTEDRLTATDIEDRVKVAVKDYSDRCEVPTGDDNICNELRSMYERMGGRLMADIMVGNEDDSDNEDIINHPDHYNHLQIEVIDIIKASLTDDEYRGYLLGNIIKYRMRAGWKGDRDTDYKKSSWYQDQLKEVK